MANSKKLNIAERLSLPLEAVTQTFGILAKRGAGKTYTANVMTEEMLKAGLHVVVIDPIGVWYGLRSSADGKSEGLPIIIAGGEHADIPLTPESGELLAELIIENRLSMVIDISLFRKAGQTKFMTDFAETIYRKNRNALHLMVDEADAFAPQKPQPGQQRMLGAMEDLVRRGRARGIGMTMITQRPAVLNKNVLTQIEVLVTLRLTAPNDQKAVDEWVKSNAEAGQREEFMGAISSLPIGDAYFWSPGWLKIFQRVHIRKRETLDSSSTPIAGKEVIRPEKMAAIDIDKIIKQLETTAEHVISNDPKVLQKRVTELEAELKDVKPQVVEKIVKIPTFSAKQMSVLHENIPAVIGVLQEIYDATADEATKPLARGGVVTFGSEPVGDRDFVIRDPIKDPMPKARTAVTYIPKNSNTPIRGGALRMVDVVVRAWPVKYTKSQMAYQAKMRPTSGTFGTYLAAIKREGYLSEEDGMIIPSDAAFELIGVKKSGTKKSPEEKQEMWRNVLQGGARRMFDVLIGSYPTAISREDLAYSTDMSPDSGTFGTYLGTLRRNKLIVNDDDGRVVAAEILFKEESIMKGEK